LLNDSKNKNKELLDLLAEIAARAEQVEQVALNDLILG
jgi:hypothetical protein